jgi:hypothetical protein
MKVYERIGAHSFRVRDTRPQEEQDVEILQRASVVLRRYHWCGTAEVLFGLAGHIEREAQARSRNGNGKVEAKDVSLGGV